MNTQPNLLDPIESTDAFADLGYVSRREVDASLSKEHNRAAPKGEDGHYLVEEIKRGQYLLGWGAVTGRGPRPSDTSFDDVVDHPRSVPPARRPFLAAQHYARLINAGAEAQALRWREHAAAEGWLKA